MRAVKRELCARPMGDIYGKESGTTKLRDNELVALGEQLKGGVPIATPVFDGAREPDIVSLAAKGGFRHLRPGDAV